MCDVFSVKMSRTTARSREVLITLLSFVVTTPHHHCSVANMARDPVDSVGRTLTILVYCLLAHTAPTFILHVLMHMYRKPALMFTTYPFPAEFSAMKCLRPMRIVVDRPNGYDVLAQSYVRSLRAVALAGQRWSSSTVTSLSWRSAVVVLSHSLMPASILRKRLIGFRRAMVNCAYGAKSFFGGILCLQQ